MKRFYSQVAVAESVDGFGVRLDGRDLRTPAGQPLRIASRQLAEAVAEEWQSQGETVRPESMPLMQLASTAVDRVAPNRAAIIDQLVGYGGTDLVCYRADSPRDLVERQERVWQPVVDWAAVGLGAELVVTSGVIPLAQPAETLERLRIIIEGYDDLRLTALQSAVAAMGSLLLGLALVEGELEAEEAFAASQLDELYEIEFWGEDEEARIRRDALRTDVASAARLLELCLP